MGFLCDGATFLDYIKNDKTFLEKEPLEKLLKKENLLHLNTKTFGNVLTL